MKHTRALIVLALALLAGLVSVTLAARWMSGHKTPGAHIAVAAREIDLGTALDATAITTLAWPGGSLPEGAFPDPAALQGRVVRTSLARGEPILASKLAPVGARGGLAAAIGEGRRAITVRVNEVIGVARSVGNLSLVLRNPVDRREAATAGMGKADLFGTPGSPVPVAVRSVATRPAAGAVSRARAPAPAPVPIPVPVPAAAPSRPPAPTEPPTRIEVIRGVSRTTVEL